MSRNQATRYNAPQASSQGKHHAPQGITRPVYRGSARDKAEGYFREHDSRYIATQRDGDFHTSKQTSAYFTFDKEYARNVAPSGGTIIRQDVPREMLRQGYKFDDAPSEDWYHFVEKCRKNEKAEGRMLKVQKMNVIEGPIAGVHNKTLQRPPPIPKEKFKQVKQGDEYVQQVVFKGEALENPTRLPCRPTL
ncbi:hypothetical protein GGR52DRAFT_551126 [Hypoxylon sp. FL1284]|nr:hypothetical protein GGR52DRAFT_551126 [Hypoxylon sp. FL1284]